ncbi:hypothetical protein ABPG74_013194 [Tetrahymena malaccensis]
MEEEDSLNGAPKRRQLFMDLDTREIYHKKNLENTSQAFITLNSQNCQPDDEQYSIDVSQVEKNNLDVKKINSSICNMSVKNNEIFNKESSKGQEFSSNVLIAPKIGKLQNEVILSSFDRIYGINIQQLSSNADVNISINNSQIQRKMTNHFSREHRQDLKSIQEQEYLKEQKIFEELGLDENEEDEVIRAKKLQRKQEFQEIWIRLGSVLFNVRKFFKVLKAQCSYFKYKILMEYHNLHIIGDKAFFQKGNQDDTHKQNVINDEDDKNCISKFQEPISPDDFVILVWESYLLIILSIESFIIPFKSCFKVNMLMVTNFLVYIPMITYLLEMLLNLNKGFFNQGNLILKRSLIVKNYLKKQFFLDLTCLFSTYYYLNLGSFEYLSIAFLITRIIQIQRISSRLDESYQLQFKYPEASELSRLILIIIFIAHLTGCGFHFVGMYISDNQENWLQKYKIYDASLFERQNKFQIQQYMINRKINVKLQRKILRALEYADQQEQRGSQQGEMILKKVQIHLQNEIKQDFFGKILQNHKIFQLNFSKNFLKHVSLKMTEKLLARDDILYSQGETDENYYIVLSGKLEIFIITQEQVKLGNILPGQGTGQRGFFTGLPRTLFAKSSEITRVVSINRTSFIEVIKNYPLDYQRYCCIKDQILFEMKEFDLQCSACLQFNHGVLECPIINPKKDMNDRNINYIIQNKGKDCIQLRKSYERQKKKKFNTFKYESEVRYKLREIRLDITGILNQEIQKRDNSDKYLDEHDIFENFNDFEFFVKCPIIKMVKSEYNEMIYELIVDEDDEEIGEDIPFLECIQEYLKQEQNAVQEKESDFVNQASTFKVLCQQNTNEASVTTELNSADLNEQNQEFQPKETSIIENLNLQQQILPQNGAKQAFSKKQKTGNLIKGMNQIYSMDLDNDVLREQNNQQNDQNNIIQTEAYFQGLERKINKSSFEQDILKLFNQQNQTNGSKLKIDCSLYKSQCTRKKSQDQEFPEYPDSPLKRPNKSNNLKEGKSNQTNTASPATSETNNNQNQNPGILIRTNKKRITKTVTINQIEHQLLNQMSRQISTTSNQPSQCSQEQNSDLKNSIKVHHQKQSSTNYSEKTQNQPILNSSSNNSVLSMKVNLPTIQEGKEAQPSSFKYIKPPSSNMIANHSKQRQSAVVGLDFFNNIHFLQSMAKEKIKVHSDEQMWSLLPDFETFKAYQRYFPLNNIEKVIMRYNRLQEKKVKRQNQRENQPMRGKTIQYLNRCFNNKQSTPQQKRRGADKSLISNINQQINQLSISALKEKKKKQKLDQDTTSQNNNRSRKQTYNSNFQRSSSRVDKDSEFSII